MAARGKLAGARVASDARSQQERRLLLPSNRVAVFRMPNVGEYLDLRTEAIRRAIHQSPNGKPSDSEIALEVGRMLVRRQLVGLTPEPVALVYKNGFDPAVALPALRAKLEADNSGVDIEATLEATEDSNEDVEATKASARPQPITDLTWDEQEGEVGKYLALVPTCGLDTPEGRDWESLNDYAALVMPSAMRGLDSPKAGRPRIRSLR